MSEAARVTAIEALTAWKAALAGFRAQVLDALCAADLEARRAGDWLADQLQSWRRAVRECEDQVTEAKNELARRRLFRLFDQPPDCTEQERALRRAQQRLEEAQDKAAACRRWGPQLRRAVEEYEGPTRQLGNLAEADLPRALALLDRLAAALDAYVDLAPPAPPPRSQP